jgi:hypothetical protein
MHVTSEGRVLRYREGVTILRGVAASKDRQGREAKATLVAKCGTTLFKRAYHRKQEQFLGPFRMVEHLLEGLFRGGDAFRLAGSGIETPDLAMRVSVEQIARR